MAGRRWPIRYKLAIILVIPLLSLAVVSVTQVAASLRRVAAADRVGTQAEFAVTVASTVHELQRERGLSGGYVGSKHTEGRERLDQQRVRVDAAIRVFNSRAAGVRGRSWTHPVRGALDDAVRRMDGLPDHRRQVNAGLDSGPAGVEATLGYFTDAIEVLLSIDRRLVTAHHDVRIERRAEPFLQISEAKEYTGQERGLMNTLFSEGFFDPGEFAQFQHIIGAEDAWLQQFRSSASPEQVELYDRTVRGPDVQRASAYRESASQDGEKVGRHLRVPPAQWWSAMTTKIDLMHTVELSLARSLQQEASQVADAARGAAIRSAVLAALVLSLSVGLSVVVARSMARSLRRLRGAAIAAADAGMPGVVARLAAGEHVDADLEVAPVMVRSNDEVGDTAEAFNRVHRVAVRLTVEQAGMRKTLGDTLLNLARRSQGLVHRQLELIDDLERHENDSGQLQSLFRLDHLATRMRRHTEDLIVLSGAAPSRVWGAPVRLRDVLRGAVAEVENYPRVKIARVPNVAVLGHAVGDLVHLLAELIENATSFSPPHTPVHVVAQEVGTGLVVEVEDRGLGMTDGELSRLNQRLATPPSFDLSTSERLGLYVVGQLAARHGVHVRLRASFYGGVTAVVLLGKELFAASTYDQTAGLATGGTPRPVLGEPAANGRRLLPAEAWAPAGVALGSGAGGVGSASGALGPGTDEADAGAPGVRVDGRGPAGAGPGAAGGAGAEPISVTGLAGVAGPAGTGVPGGPGGPRADRPFPDVSAGPRGPVSADLPGGAGELDDLDGEGVEGPAVRRAGRTTGADARLSEPLPFGPAVPFGTPELSLGRDPARPPVTSGAPFASETPVPFDAPAPSGSGDVAGRRGQARSSAGGFTEVGLPRRTPRQSLAPGLRRDGGGQDATPGGTHRRHRRPRAEWPAPTPEEIRSMLSGYQLGFDRARGEAGDDPPDDDATWRAGGSRQP